MNEIPIEPNKRFSITHNDKLKIGNNTLLLHVHAGVTTCLDCEPGHVMKKYEKIKFNEKLDTVNIEISRREINREMKKKYGLKWNNFDKPTGGAIELSEDSKKNKYLDRSKLRRDEAGIDYSHIMDKNEPTTASVQSSITNGNIGFKLLKNMGWNEGKGLGKHESGILEPVNAKMRITSSGLGFEASELNMDVSHEQKNKHINWNKTKNRYNLINTSSNLSNVFNIESDTED